MYSSFEDLEVWQRSCSLAVRVYEVLKSCRDYGLKDQMTRAAVSIASNIRDTFMDLAEIKQKIIFLLRPLEPEKVILFGSYAWGEPTEESDIDIYVVTKDSVLPGSYQEMSEIRLQYARAISDLVGLIPVDLIVHTHPMHDKFVEVDSMFSRKILQSGISLV